MLHQPSPTSITTPCRSIHTNFLDIASTRDTNAAPDDHASRAAVRHHIENGYPLDIPPLQVEALARVPSIRARPPQQPSNPPKGEHELHGPPPRDWSLLSTLRITADVPALQTHLWQAASGAPGSPDLSWWQHPAQRLAADAVVALVQAGHTPLLAARYGDDFGGNETCHVHMHAQIIIPTMCCRRAAHREALRSLYYAVRRGACDCFYWLPPLGSRRPMCVLLRSAGTAGIDDVHALVSHSSKGLRQLLRSPAVGVTFSMPWSPQGSEDDEVGVYV